MPYICLCICIGAHGMGHTSCLGMYLYLYLYIFFSGNHMIQVSTRSVNCSHRTRFWSAMNKKTNCVEKFCWLKFCNLETKTNMRYGVGWGCSLPLSQSLSQPGGGSTTISVVKMRSCFKMSGDIPPCLEFSSCCSYSTHSHSTRESYYG